MPKPVTLKMGPHDFTEEKKDLIMFFLLNERALCNVPGKQQPPRDLCFARLT